MTPIEYDEGQIAVLCPNESLLSEAKTLASTIDAEVEEILPGAYQGEANYLLVYSAHGVELLPRDKKQGGAVKVCFTEGKADHRRKYGGGAGQMIAKAVGIKSGIKPQVLDATAGLGQDSFVMASLGCTVTAIERSPVVFELLKSGLDHAKCSEDDEIQSIASRITLLSGNAIEWLSAQSEPVADVIYLDPMFPEKGKSSLAKKEMRYFKHIVGKDDDAADLLNAAIEKARYRVVVKRPRLATTIGGLEPSYSIEGKSNRYDIYVFKSLDRLKSTR